jgi:hypothetical protein
MITWLIVGLLAVVGFFALDYYNYRKQRARKTKCCGGKCHTKKEQQK